MFGEIFVLALTGFILRCLFEMGMNWIRTILGFRKKEDELKFTDLLLGVKDLGTQLLMLVAIIVCFTYFGKNPLNQDPYFLLGLFLPEAGKMLVSLMRDSKPQPK